jgi:peroxiredoxin
MRFLRSIFLPAMGVCLLYSGSLCGLELGKPAPALSATLIDGSQFVLSDHRDEVVIVNFWATWCTPCVAELQVFEDYYRDHKADGVTVLAISMDDPEDRKSAEKMTAKYAFPIAMYHDVNAEGYGRIWQLPMSFVIDRKGMLRIDGGEGEQKPFDKRTLEHTINPLLQNPK